jgi:hypothetical protein
MGAVAQRPKAGDVVGMQVRVHRLNQPQIELFHELQIAIDLLQHRIDDQRLAARSAGQQVGVGAGYLIKELAEHHGATPAAAEYTNSYEFASVQFHHHQADAEINDGRASLVALILPMMCGRREFPASKCHR